MEKKNMIRRLLPCVVAVLSFAAVSFFYFLPQFEGRQIVMNDVVQYEGSAKDLKDHYEAWGEDAQWTGTSFSGMPATLTYMHFEGQLIRDAFPVLEFMGRPAALVFLAMLSFFVMLVMMRVDPRVAIVGALAYGLSTYFMTIIGAGHINKMIALAYAPLMAGGVHYTLRRNMWLGAALTALFGSIQLAANHPQITYYFAMVLFAMWVNEGVRAVRKRAVPRFAKATGLLVVAAVLAVGSNLSSLWYTNEYSEYSTRGGSELTAAAGEAKSAGLDLDYATQWSYGVAETFDLYIPYLYGGSSEGNFAADGAVASSLAKYGEARLATRLPSYWGDQPMTSGPTYLGAVAVMLALMAAVVLRRRNAVWIGVVTLVAVMLAWGHNFMWFTRLFFDLVPGYDKFRAVSMTLVIVEWSVPLLGAFVLHKLWRSADADGLYDDKGRLPRERVKKALTFSLAVAGGISLLFIVLGGALFNFSAPGDAAMASWLPDDVLGAMRGERASMMRADSFRSLVFVLLTAGAVLLFVRRRIKRGVMVAIIGVLVTVDMVAVDLRFLPHERFTEPVKAPVVATAADLAIMADTEPGFRVLNLTVSPFNDATTSYFHRSVGGYHGAKMQRYQDLIDRYLGASDMDIYDMLNTKYVITGGEQGPVAQLNAGASGAAWFVDDARIVSSADEEIAAIGEEDLKRVAVVDNRFADDLASFHRGADSLATIRLTDYKPNRLTYEYSATQPSLAVFSEIYYDKGWTAFVDGEEAPHFRADYVLRAMVLPAGEHTVEFRFRAENFDRVSRATLWFSLLILASVAAAGIAAALCKKKKERDVDAG